MTANDTTTETNDLVRQYWDTTPCGTREATLQEGSREFFDEIEGERERREPFIDKYARFGEWQGRRVLEVGSGVGTDLVRFVRAGALAHGLEVTPRGVALARRRLALEGLDAPVTRGDAEKLPFADGTFDHVYSWGVIHHTSDTEGAAREILRVTRPGGEVCVMIYHRYSLVALQCWFLHALLKGRPWRTLAHTIADNIESIGTKAYSTREANSMFCGLQDLRVTPVVTPYDTRLTRRLFLPEWFRRTVPRGLGWFLVIQGRKG